MPQKKLADDGPGIGNGRHAVALMPRMIRVYVCLLCLLPLCAGAQKAYRLVVMPDSAARQYGFKTSFANREAAANYVAMLPATLRGKGYLAAAIDAVRYDSLRASVHVFLGPRYHWAAMPLPAPYTRLVPQAQGGRHASPEATKGKLLDYFLETGHPFARVAVDSISLWADSISGKWVIEPGVPYKLDSVQLLGGLKLRPAYLYRYLQLKTGMPYNQRAINTIDARLAELGFAEVAQPMELSMVATGATAKVYLKPRRSNVINVLLGAMPQSTQTPNNKLQITGEANILLRNAFANGESIGINWQQLQYKSPRLNLSFQQPYLFGTALGADLFFDFLRKDTQFLTINFRLGVPYQLGQRATAKVFFQQFTTTVSGVDTPALLQKRQLPDINDVGSSNVGVEYQQITTDYRLNPRQGGELLANAMAGLKQLKQNAAIANLKDPNDPNFDFGTLYDTLKQNTYQLRLRVSGAHYQPVGKGSTLKLGVQAAWLQSENYFRNELYQLGGYKLLRGFDEESIFARGYAVGTAEYRLLTGRNGYFFGFVDVAYTQYKDERQQMDHTYWGAGLGLNVDTKNSLINLSWAVGQRNDLPFNLRQSKIHLGLINYF
ncbi:MAG: hypothetical protein EAY75_14610 [Bacteroidetes bacterium]|nr:MAG: hypothetical protein EAY75_14610 [Bacteroidota bacterium]